MPLEAVQLLCTAYLVQKYVGHAPRKITAAEFSRIPREDGVYTAGFGHYNHPCSIWTRSSRENFEWTYLYASALNSEYGYRYRKSHKSLEVANALDWPEIPVLGLTPFAQAMPVQYQQKDAVEAYRQYYINEKAPLAKWKFREEPHWWPSQNLKSKSIGVY